MTRSWMWPALAVGLGCSALAFLMIKGGEKEPEWTSRSPEALKEVQAGLDDVARLYWTDAVAHFERALELDGDMPIAKLQLALLYQADDGQRRRLWKELQDAELDELSDQERFLIEYWLARRENRTEQSRELLDTYLSGLKDADGDPHALTVLCDDHWENQRWDEAEPCYRRLIARHPNWVQAQSRLGLIAMAKGEFDLADESFQTFRYIAPDQAAPYDSIGQLQTVLGQYEAAEASFENALRVKPDYCMAVQHLRRLYFMWGQWEKAAEAIQRMEDIEGCSYIQDWGLICAGRAWNAYVAGDLATADGILAEGCLERRGGFDLLAYRMAVLAGDFDRADVLEAAIEGHIDEKSGTGFQGRRSYLESLLFHVRGVRRTVEGDWPGACEHFKQSDDLSLYWGLERASFKLYNKIHLMRCYELTGHPTAAMAERGKINSVNPRYLKVDRLVDLEGLQPAATQPRALITKPGDGPGHALHESGVRAPAQQLLGCAHVRFTDLLRSAVLTIAEGRARNPRRKSGKSPPPFGARYVGCRCPNRPYALRFPGWPAKRTKPSATSSTNTQSTGRTPLEKDGVSPSSRERTT